MAYSIVLGGDQWSELASLSGMRDFREWVDGLPESPQLKHLVEHGWSQELQAMEDELRAGSPDASTSAGSVAYGLLVALSRRNQDAESAMITDGMHPDDGKNGEWVFSDEDEAELSITDE